MLLSDGPVDLDNTCLSAIWLRQRLRSEILVDICGPQSPHGKGDCIDSSLEWIFSSRLSAIETVHL